MYLLYQFIDFCVDTLELFLGVLEEDSEFLDVFLRLVGAIVIAAFLFEFLKDRKGGIFVKFKSV